MLVENPTDSATLCGYPNNVPNLLPAFGSNKIASKPEADKNTYRIKEMI